MIELSKLVSDLNLEYITTTKKEKNKSIKSEMISRPGMELAGYFDYFDKDRIVLIGSKEMGYLNTLKETLSIERFTSLLEFNPPCIILSVNVILPNYLFELTKNYNVPILKSKLRTTPFYSLLYGYLHQRLTPRIKVKGTSLDIYGVGVLLIGEENIGKSETALELINRGHLLINDDYVQLYEEYPSSIFAESFNQDIILNGIGRFDVKQHYGTKSFKETTKIDLVINFLSVVPQSNKKGLNISSYNILNSVIPEIIFPVKKSQNMITLIESAVVYYKSSNIRPTAKSK